jgi:hypothetical protein
MAIHSKRAFSSKSVDRLRQFLETWPKTMPAPEYGSCPSPIWQETDDKKTLRFYWEKWFPEEWIEPLAHALASELPSLTMLEVGQDFEPPYRDDGAFIAVPRKVVQFEDGTKVDVTPFEIAKYPVSVGQFEAFTAATGYKTSAEQEDYETFRDNQFIGDIPADKRANLGVNCLSYQDALAYCDWARVRLPTEAEWLAAAVIDDRVREDHELDIIRTELRKKPTAIVVGAAEMTGTVVNERFVVVRCGPYLVRGQRDLSRSDNRRTRRISACEDAALGMSIHFRVCR